MKINEQRGGFRGRFKCCRGGAAGARVVCSGRIGDGMDVHLLKGATVRVACQCELRWKERERLGQNFGIGNHDLVSDRAD